MLVCLVKYFRIPRSRKTQLFFNLKDALEIVEEDDVVVDNVVVLPPAEQGNVTDEEETDEGIIIPNDIPGHVEVDYEVDSPDDFDDAISEENLVDVAADSLRNRGKKRQKRSLTLNQRCNWSATECLRVPSKLRILGLLGSNTRS